VRSSTGGRPADTDGDDDVGQPSEIAFWKSYGAYRRHGCDLLPDSPCAEAPAGSRCALVRHGPAEHVGLEAWVRGDYWASIVCSLAGNDSIVQLVPKRPEAGKVAGLQVAETSNYRAVWPMDDDHP